MGFRKPPDQKCFHVNLLKVFTYQRIVLLLVCLLFLGQQQPFMAFYGHVDIY
jgi:hypothetical protein